MARYTGPKTKIARSLERLFSEMINLLKKETTLQVNTEIPVDVEKNLSTPYNLWKSKKLNTLMVF